MLCTKQVASFREIFQTLTDTSQCRDCTVDGKCSRCGECCGNLLPLTEQEVTEIRRYIRRRGIKEQEHFVPAAGPVIDYTCPFYDSDNKCCVVYAVRPTICREYKCDKAVHGVAMDRAVYHRQTVRVVDMRDTFFGKER